MAYQKMLSELKQTFLSLEKAVVPEILKALKEIMPQLQAGLIAVIPLFKNLLGLIAPTTEELAKMAKYFEKVGENLAEQEAIRPKGRKSKPLIENTEGQEGLLWKWISAASPIVMKTPVMSALSGTGLTNVTIESLTITTQATDAQGVAKATVNAIANIANQTGR